MIFNSNGEVDFIGWLFLILLTFCLFGIILGITDSFYAEPTASQKANDHCKAIGFDQYKSFSRIGILSKTPVGIKCEYAERYTDLGIRTNDGGV